MITAIAALILFALLGAGMAATARMKIQDGIFRDTQNAATDWAGSLDPSAVPQVTHESGIDLLQLVDSHDRVKAATEAAKGLPPLSHLRPPETSRIKNEIVCTRDDGCLLVTAVRVPPLSSRVLWAGEPHYVFAGKPEPPLLTANRLELLTAAAVLLATGLAAWVSWWVVGRTLRPVAAIRARTAEISVSDLSLRVPEPPGDDEIAQLARTSNETLARLEQAVEQQRQFASLVSHELRSPVAALHAHLDEALMYPEDVDTRQTFQSALAATERLQAIIDDILVLARMRTTVRSGPEPIDLSALVKGEAANCPHTPPVYTHLLSEITVMANRISLVRVVDNLLVNAQRHAESRVDVTTARSGDQAVLTVTDDGDGIAPEDRERVFEAFVRLDEGRRRDPGGSGLGLAICRAIASAHHGTLTIEDSPRGARFVLRLPLRKTQPIRAQRLTLRRDPAAQAR
ncbi:hypothetical protein Ssi03_18660 [Sphaerisporangium siamense]|uniref:histidine kinase n=1 Tax=Sphaerisporangium siamense TaxID=795645 RepID=A0A7W7GDK3_9ACTN|nr:ATP-binding protein [Sphaerisporangium siamense]MBB4705070.1 signal transduction histidine kinase [Sphaerisporangium siamense]GII83876.1 hypothetical protein Ssi03_18660 [Sphaerisporangium siamense]